MPLPLCLLPQRPPISTLFPYTTLFRSGTGHGSGVLNRHRILPANASPHVASPSRSSRACSPSRSEEHTSELQSREHLVYRSLLEKKNNNLVDLYVIPLLRSFWLLLFLI